MEQIQKIEAELAGLPVGGIRHLTQVGSTNDEAARWAAEGAPHLALVIADEQTAGRGRTGRTWYSPAGSSLAFSLVLYPQQMEAHYLPRLTALGALAVKDALQKAFDLPAQIKWPNDVLVHRHKVCGVLAEAQWEDDRVKTLILGIGINIAQAGIAQIKYSDRMAIPAASLETFLGKSVARWDVLRPVIEALVYWLPRLTNQDFLYAWESSLAFRGEWVQVTVGQTTGKDGLPQALEGRTPVIEEGKMIGLAQDGSLRLRKASGEIAKVSVGEVHLRPAPS